MGLSFVSSSATSAEVVFAYDGPWANDGYRVQLATLTLGARNVLGRYACTAPGVATLTASAVSTLTPGGSLGNPNARGGFLWVDDEAAGDLRYWVISGQDGGLSGSSLSAEKNVANPGDTAHRRIMPFFDSATHTLFYSTAAKSIDSRVLTGSDPSSAADWSAAASPVLVADTVSTQGHLFALGEPSIANLPSGARELYFIFVLKTATGVDASVGRVSRSEH